MYGGRMTQQSFWQEVGGFLQEEKEEENGKRTSHPVLVSLHVVMHHYIQIVVIIF
jgi:hypothetical protein